MNVPACSTMATAQERPPGACMARARSPCIVQVNQSYIRKAAVSATIFCTSLIKERGNHLALLPPGTTHAPSLSDQYACTTTPFTTSVLPSQMSPVSHQLKGFATQCPGALS